MHEGGQWEALRWAGHDDIHAEEVVLIFHDLDGGHPGEVLEGLGERAGHNGVVGPREVLVVEKPERGEAVLGQRLRREQLTCLRRDADLLAPGLKKCERHRLMTASATTASSRTKPARLDPLIGLSRRRSTDSR